MSSSLVPYPSVHPFRSQIVKGTPDVVPPTEELEALHAELTELRQHTLERAKKADEDLRTIEESMRKLKEKEKGKAKLVERTKRECVYYFLPLLLVDLIERTPLCPCFHLRPLGSLKPCSTLIISTVINTLDSVASCWSISAATFRDPWYACPDIGLDL